MKKYRAHYKSPHSANPVNGTFEFESDSNAGSRANMSDARIKMLETFGKEAVSWQIDKIEKAPSRDSSSDTFVQPQLDFREPKKVIHHRKFKRGTL